MSAWYCSGCGTAVDDLGSLTGASAGQSIFAFTRGTPVIGELPAGDHTLEYVYFVDGEDVATFTRDIESSPDHC